MGSRGEICEPVRRINKFGDLLDINLQVLHDLILGNLWHNLGLGLNGLLPLFHFFLDFFETQIFDFFFELLSGGADGHTGAVEAEGEEDVEASHPLVPGGKLGLEHGENVAKVDSAVHVRVWESDHKFLLSRFGSSDVYLLVSPKLLGFDFVLFKHVPSDE